MPLSTSWYFISFVHFLSSPLDYGQTESGLLNAVQGDASVLRTHSSGRHAALSLFSFLTLRIRDYFVCQTYGPRSHMRRNVIYGPKWWQFLQFFFRYKDFWTNFYTPFPRNTLKHKNATESWLKPHWPCLPPCVLRDAAAFPMYHNKSLQSSQRENLPRDTK